MSKNSITDFWACTALSLWLRTIMPGETGVAHAGKGFGAFSTSTRHMRQFAAIDNFL
jgi:hypothetical protein